MLEKIDKRDRAHTFRDRLTDVMARRALTQSALARAAGIDRSTVSQLLSAQHPRLPGGQVVGDLAAILRVSADWLLGLSDRPESAADLLAASLTVSQAARALVDETIFGWHREAAGYKIRHVPAALPDMLKTRAMMVWEYTPHLGRTTDGAIASSQTRLDWMRASASDYEIAMPIFELEAFAHGTGYYHDLALDVRLEQLDHFLTLHDQLFPRLRIFLYDARQVFASPVTVFGPLMAVLYAGQHYLAFRDSERVAAFSRDFDQLVRNAWITDRDFPGHVRALRAAVQP